MILPQNEAFGHGLERIEFFHQDPFCPRVSQSARITQMGYRS